MSLLSGNLVVGDVFLVLGFFWEVSVDDVVLSVLGLIGFVEGLWVNVVVIVDNSVVSRVVSTEGAVVVTVMGISVVGISVVGVSVVAVLMLSIAIAVGEWVVVEGIMALVSVSVVTVEFGVASEVVAGESVTGIVAMVAVVGVAIVSVSVVRGINVPLAVVSISVGVVVHVVVWSGIMWSSVVLVWPVGLTVVLGVGSRPVWGSLAVRSVVDSLESRVGVSGGVLVSGLEGVGLSHLLSVKSLVSLHFTSLLTPVLADIFVGVLLRVDLKMSLLVTDKSGVWEGSVLSLVVWLVSEGGVHFSVSMVEIGSVVWGTGGPLGTVVWVSTVVWHGVVDTVSTVDGSISVDSELVVWDGHVMVWLSVETVLDEVLLMGSVSPDGILSLSVLSLDSLPVVGLVVGDFSTVGSLVFVRGHLVVSVCLVMVVGFETMVLAVVIEVGVVSDVMGGGIGVEVGRLGVMWSRVMSSEVVDVMSVSVSVMGRVPTVSESVDLVAVFVSNSNCNNGSSGEVSSHLLSFRFLNF